MPRSEIQEFCPVSQVEPLTLRSVEGGSGGGLAQGPKPIVLFARRVDFSRRILLTRHNVRIMHHSGPYTSDASVPIGALHEHKGPTLTATGSVKGSTIQNLRDASFIVRPRSWLGQISPALVDKEEVCRNVVFPPL
jgi:hypothetical protein